MGGRKPSGAGRAPIAVGVLAILLGAANAPAQTCRDESDPLSLTLTVERARALDDTEGCCGGDPELYVEVWVGGVRTCTLGPTGSSRSLDGPLACTFQVAPPYGSVDLQLRLYDEDGGAGGDHDHLDISPIAGLDLDVRYSPRCDRLTDGVEAGEVPGCPVGSVADACAAAERTFQGNGGGDGRGSVTFKIGPADGLSPVNDDLALNGLEVIQVVPNPDAAVHDRLTMVRATVSNTYTVDQTPLVRAHAVDELGNVFDHELSPTIPACSSLVVNFYPPGWDGSGSTAWGFRPQASTGTIPVRLDVSVTADPSRLIDTCGTDCPTNCRIRNNGQRNNRIPVKFMKDLSVLFQPISASLANCDGEAGAFADADATRAAAVPYIREIYPAQTVAGSATNEVLDFSPWAPLPHATLAMMDLAARLADGFDRVLGVAKGGYFECHYVGAWATAIGASLGEPGGRLSVLESPASAVSSELAAHELAHTYGLSEAPCPIAWPESIWACVDEYNWCPDGAGGRCPSSSGVAARGFRVLTGASMDTAECLMGDSDADDGANPDDWIDDVDYGGLLDRLKIDPDPELVWLRLRLRKGLFGTIYRDDASRILGTPDVLSETGGGTLDSSNDTTSLVFKTSAGAVLDRVHFTPESVDTDGDRRDDAFGLPDGEAPVDEIDLALAVALPPGTQTVELWRRTCVGGTDEDCTGGIVQEAITDSFFTPTETVAIELLHPPSSFFAPAGQVVPIEWRDLPGAAAGPEATGPRLSWILMSPDDGTHWIPLSGRVSGHRYDWRPRLSGRYWVRVFSTNGFHTGDARGESDTDRDGCGNSRDPDPTDPDPDADGDSIATVCDNCPTVANPFQQNPDGDPRGSACDNCPAVASDDQTDSDGDGHGNPCDCAPTSSTTWEIPVEASGLRVGKIAANPAAVTLGWDSLEGQAGTSIRYDVPTGSLSQLRSTGGFGGANCLVNDATTTSVNPTQVWPPPTGTIGYWYLVRGQNPCGQGTYGNGTPVPDPRDPLDGSGSPCP